MFRAVQSIAFAVALTWLVGCGRGGLDPKIEEGAAKLPGAKDVLAAIEKKDYDRAVAALMNVQASLTTEEQLRQFKVLAWQARERIYVVGTTNEKALQAAMTISAMTVSPR
jgi:hypothetical protein